MMWTHGVSKPTGAVKGQLLAECSVGLKRGCKKPEGSFFLTEKVDSLLFCISNTVQIIIKVTSSEHHHALCAKWKVRFPPKHVGKMKMTYFTFKLRTGRNELSFNILHYWTTTICLKDMITHWVACVHRYKRTHAQSSFHHVRKSPNLKAGLSLSSEVPTDGGSVL